MFIDVAKIPSVGEPRIDRAHRALAEQANALFAEWRAQGPTAELLKGFQLLVRQIGRHFAEEEAIAEEVGFTGLERHKARHREFLDTLTQAVAQLERRPGSADATIDLFSFVDTLLYEHEILDDQELWPLFREHDAKYPPSGPILPWGHDLMTGHPEVDRQHRLLLEVLNALKAALDAGAPASEILELLDRLITQAAHHFAWEERQMEAVKSAQLAAHRLLHNQLLADLEDVKERYSRGGYEDLEDVLQSYLKYWFLDHVMHVDMHLVRSLKEDEG